MVYTRYGPPEVLRLREVEKPSAGDNEVLIRVRAFPVTASDCMMRKGEPFIGRLFTGLRRPQKAVPGVEFAGVVEAMGRKVKKFSEGERVFGSSDTAFGAHAEYVRLSADGLLATIPAAITFEEAAPVCDGALTAMNFLRCVANVRSGQKVLIIGAGGGVGSSAVQLAGHFGAVVTGVCSTAGLELVKSLGADRVIDYTREEFTADGIEYDIIFDTVGKSSFSRCKASLTEKGVYLSTVPGVSLFLRTLTTSGTHGRKAKFSATGLRSVPERQSLLDGLAELFAAGRIRTVIDRRYSLDGIAEAHRYVESGHKKGNVVVTV